MNVGDLVCLRSTDKGGDGPLMTVVDVDPNHPECAWTSWFTADNQVHSEEFPVAALVLVEEVVL